MSVAAALALANKRNFSTQGVDVTITPGAGPQISTKGIWTAYADDPQPVGGDRRRRDPRRVMALDRTVEGVDQINRGALLEAPERGEETIRCWRVDNFERVNRFYLMVTLEPRSESV